MLNTLAARLKVCRAITGLSSTYIVDQINARGIEFSRRQFSRWENISSVDTNRIAKENALECIVDIFNENGLHELSSEWLLYGKGIPPFLVDMENTLEEEKAFYISRAMGKDYKLITIASNFAEPFASPGEQIIIRYAEPEKLENKIAFIKTSEFKLYFGLLNNHEDHVTITNFKESVQIDKKDIENCGRLIWVS